MEQKKFKIKSKNALSSLTESVLSLAKNNSPVAESPRADAVGEITIDQIIESTGGLVTDLQAEDRLYMETVVNGKYEARATTVASIAEFGGELPDLTEYAKLEDLDTATNFTAINPTLDTPAPEVLDKVVTDIENEVKTNTTAITGLTGRVENLEKNSGGGGGVEFVEPIYIPIVSADINTADASIIVDLSAYPDNTSFCIDIDILDTEAIFIIKIIGTDALNGFLEELYLRGNIGYVQSSSTKATDLFIEGVKIVGILARVVLHRIKCRYTINGIDNIFYYAKYDVNKGYIDAIYTDSSGVSESASAFETTDATTFFYALEPLKLKDSVTEVPYTELAYISISLGKFKYHIDCSILLINSVLSTENPNNKYAQDNVQDYLLIYGRRTYLPNIYFPIVYPDRTFIVLRDNLVEGSWSDYIETVSGNTFIYVIPYRITAIGRFGKVMDVGKMTEQA